MTDPDPQAAPITPLPVPPGVAGLVLVGGAFDPPHHAHVALPVLARDHVAGGDAWLVYVPAARSPHKERAPRAADADRVEMLRLALQQVPRSCTWTDEIDRAQGSAGAPSFWIDTLERVRRVSAPGTRLRFVIGADQAAAFHRWRRPRDILALAEPIVLLRPPFGTPAALLDALRASAAWDAADLDRWSRSIFRAPLMDTSATAIRHALGTTERGKDNHELDPAVARYIHQKGLYR